MSKTPKSWFSLQNQIFLRPNLDFSLGSGSSSPNKDQQLRQRIQEAEINARKLGVIHTIENTAETFTAGDGTRFQVRVATALQSKPLNCGPKEDRAKSPFLRPIENGILIGMCWRVCGDLFVHGKWSGLSDRVLIGCGGCVYMSLSRVWAVWVYIVDKMYDSVVVHAVKAGVNFEVGGERLCVGIQ